MKVDPPVPVLEHPPVPASIQDSDKAIEDLTVNPEFRRLFEPREARGYSFVAPTEPERIPVRSSPALLPPPPSPLSTLTKRRPSPEPAEESGDEIEFVGSSTPSRSRKRQRDKSPRKLKLDPVSNGTQSSPFSVPDTPLRELSPTLSLLSPSHRPRTVHRSGTRALPEDVRYRLARLVNGDVQGRRAEPLSHIARVQPQLDSWLDVARYVGAEDGDFDRVRQWTAEYMRSGARKARDAGIL